MGEPSLHMVDQDIPTLTWNRIMIIQTLPNHCTDRTVPVHLEVLWRFLSVQSSVWKYYTHKPLNGINNLWVTVDIHLTVSMRPYTSCILIIGEAQGGKCICSKEMQPQGLTRQFGNYYLRPG